MSRTRRLENEEHVVGNDQTLNIGLYDSANSELSVTGATAIWRLHMARNRRRHKPFHGTVILTKTSAAGEIVLTDGNAAVTIQAADLDRRSGDYFQAIEITQNSTVIAYAQGRVLLRMKAQS